MLYYRTLMMQLAYHVPFFNRSASSKATLMCYLEWFFDFFLWIVRVRNTQEALEKQAQMSLVEVLTDSTDMNHSWVRNVWRVEPIYVCVYIYRYLHKDTFIYIYIHTQIHLCIYVYIYTNTFVYIYICVCTYIFLWQIYMYVYTVYTYIIVYPKVFCFHSNSFMFPSMALDCLSLLTVPSK